MWRAVDLPAFLKQREAELWKKTLRELAEYLQGTLENEDQKLIVTGVNGLVEAGPQDISFAVPPHVEHCHLSKAGVMVLAPEDPKLDRPVIRVKDPRAAFAALLELFGPGRMLNVS